MNKSKIRKIRIRWRSGSRCRPKNDLIRGIQWESRQKEEDEKEFRKTWTNNKKTKNKYTIMKRKNKSNVIYISWKLDVEVCCFYHIISNKM